MTKPTEPSKLIPKAPSGMIRDNNDENQFRWGRNRNLGFQIGTYLQSPPMLFSRDGHSQFLGDLYRGCSAFLIASGPSFGELITGSSEVHGKTHREMLEHPGFVTMGLNNSPRTFRPNLWTCVDDPTHFIKSIWLDPKIQKFAPMHHAEKKLFDNETWEEMDLRVGDCPNVLYYRRNEDFVAEQFLTEDTFNWGNHTEKVDAYGGKGGRSVLFVALRMLFYLGVRKLYLLGVDFNMDNTHKYHFEQDRAPGSIKGNNSSYRIMMKRLEALKPYCDQLGFEVYNCNPNSALGAFPKISFDDAYAQAVSQMPIDIAKERTSGLYDRLAKKTENAKQVFKKEGVPVDEAVVKQAVAAPGKYPEDVKIKIKVELDKRRKELNVAKEDLTNFETSVPQEMPAYEAKRAALLERVDIARKLFRETERRKNLIWFGTETVEKK